MRPIVRLFSKKYKPAAIVRTFVKKYKPRMVRRSVKKYKPSVLLLFDPRNGFANRVCSLA